MILSVCDMPEVLKVMRIINIVINIIRIFVPIILIVSAMIDLVRAITNAELNKISKPIINKVIAAILVFLIPTFVRLIATISSNNGEYTECLKDISRETIREAFARQEEALVSKAEETLNESDYNNAKYYLINITSETEKNEFKKRLDIVKEKIEEAKKPKVAQPIKPDASENVVKQEETETLKVYITKKGSYYLTRVWMVDPYSQINKQDASPYGKSLSRPSELLKAAINSKGLQNKLIVGMNASGFYLKDTYDASSVSRYPAFDRTSVGTIVITDGQVVRNAYTKAFKTWYLAGIDKDNNLRIFEDLRASSDSELNAKKAWADSVISSGIRNTFSFASPLIENGSESSNTTSMPSPGGKPKRQAICQVNTNNFAFITGSDLSRSDLINIMKGLNCQTGTNLDGGGSIALLFKPSSSSNIETVIGNGRSLTEVLYIVEQ